MHEWNQKNIKIGMFIYNPDQEMVNDMEIINEVDLTPRETKDRKDFEMGSEEDNESIGEHFIEPID